MMAERKLAKAEVHYRHGDPKGHHCGVCRHFVTPDGCRIVAGEIAPEMGCDRFLAKRAADVMYDRKRG
jgi:hypothetical protein